MSRTLNNPYHPKWQKISDKMRTKLERRKGQTARAKALNPTVKK